MADQPAYIQDNNLDHLSDAGLSVNGDGTTVSQETLEPELPSSILDMFENALSTDPEQRTLEVKVLEEYFPDNWMIEALFQYTHGDIEILSLILEELKIEGCYMRASANLETWGILQNLQVNYYSQTMNPKIFQALQNFDPGTLPFMLSSSERSGLIEDESLVDLNLVIPDGQINENSNLDQVFAPETAQKVATLFENLKNAGLEDTIQITSTARSHGRQILLDLCNFGVFPAEYSTYSTGNALTVSLTNEAYAKFLNEIDQTKLKEYRQKVEASDINNFQYPSIANLISEGVVPESSDVISILQLFESSGFVVIDITGWTSFDLQNYNNPEAGVTILQINPVIGLVDSMVLEF